MTHELDEFGKGFLVLCETFSEPVSKLKVDGYFAALADLPIEAVTLAMAQAIRTCRFFPRPVELRELVDGRMEDAADAAWGSVLREIRRVGYMGTPNVDARTMQVVRELWGSWQRLCETLPAEGAELVGWMKQFKGTYQSVRRADDRQQLSRDTADPEFLAYYDAEKRRLGIPLELPPPTHTILPPTPRPAAGDPPADDAFAQALRRWREASDALERVAAPKGDER